MISYSVFLPTEAESVTHIETQLKKTYSSKLEVNELFSQAGSKSFVIPKVEHKAHHLMMNSGSIHKHKGLMLYNKHNLSGHFLNNEVHRKCEKWKTDIQHTQVKLID